MSGVNKQKALKFHGILMNTLRTKVCGLFSISQIQCAFRGDLFVQNNERILLANSSRWGELTKNRRKFSKNWWQYAIQSAESYGMWGGNR